MNILLLGDSHSDIFVGLASNRFDMCLCQSSIFTLHRFINQDESDLWSKLDPWFKNNTNSPSSLIITGGEIDVRAHFWKHIPRSYVDSSDIETYILNTALKFYQQLVLVCEKYQLEKIAIWGAPVAGERADYNFEVPFVGSSQTRNTLVHLWNKSLLKVINKDPRISFATAYYNFIDPDTYLTIQPNPSHDGVHWHQQFGNIFWEQLISPALNSSSVVGDNFDIMKDDRFVIAESTSNGNQKYDTWARTDQLANDIDTRNILINNISYSWVRADYRSLLPENYQELSIQKLI
jgi:hypothetical protein